MNTQDLILAFNLPPQEAMKFFREKGMRLTWNWWEMWQAEHTQAFTVAKATSLDILQNIRTEVEKAIEEGITFHRFESELTPLLQSKGWWGKRFFVNPEGEIRPGFFGTPWRLKTIFNVNVQSSYMAGRYKEMMEVADTFSYWQYLTAGDEQVRPVHATLNGKVVRFDDPFWDYYYPPNGWNCRCRVRALTAGQVERYGLQIETPEIIRTEWINKATGEIHDIPVGIDPGFDYNPGKAKWEPDYRKYDPDLVEQMGKIEKRLLH